MRRLWIVLAVVFATSLYTAAGVQAAKATTKQKLRHYVSSKHKVTAASSAKKHKAAVMAARTAKGPKWVCHRVVKRHVRKAPARAARGPMVTCPAPVVNVPQQAAPIVNVPQQPAPVVNVAAPSPTVGITVDDCNIYIVQGSQLMVLDKTTYAIKQSVPLH